MAFTISRMGRADMPELSALLEWRRTGEPVAPGDMERVAGEYEVGAAALEAEDFWVLGAREGDRLVGYVTAAVLPKPDPRRGVIHVDELWVAGPHRGRGIARALLRAVEDTGRERGLPLLRVYSAADNAAARALYRSLGCRERPAVFFEKPL